MTNRTKFVTAHFTLLHAQSKFSKLICFGLKLKNYKLCFKMLLKIYHEIDAIYIQSIEFVSIHSKKQKQFELNHAES